MSRAPCVRAQAREGPSRPARRRCTRRRSAGAWSTREMPDSGRSRSARPPRSWPAIYGIGREEQDAFALRSHQRAAAAWDAGFYDAEVVAGRPTRTSARDEGIRADTLAREARQAQAGLPQGRHGDRRQRLAAQRRRRRAARASEAGAQKAGRDPLARIAGRGASAVDPDIFGIGPVEAANRALERAGISVGRRRRRRAQRGLRRPVARVRRRVAGARPGDRERPRRRDRARPPARRLRRPHPRDARRYDPEGAAGDTASPRSASAWARAWPSCWRRCDVQRRQREPSPARLSGLQVDAAAAPEAAADPAPATPDGSSTGPVLGEDRLGELDYDLTRQHDGEPQGQRIIVHGRV